VVESARITAYPRTRGEPPVSAVITGIFTIAGVVVTAAAALLAKWLKHKADHRLHRQARFRPWRSRGWLGRRSGWSCPSWRVMGCGG
jgi:hypothetical protein